jgi:hypothetical protein
MPERRICANWSIRRSTNITAASSRPPATACWRNSPAWSMRCAVRVKFSAAMADRDLDLAEERRLRFRIGVNLGDGSSTAAIFMATASISRCGWRGWRRRAASASRARSGTISAIGSLRL